MCEVRLASGGTSAGITVVKQAKDACLGQTKMVVAQKCALCRHCARPLQSDCTPPAAVCVGRRNGAGPALTRKAVCPPSGLATEGVSGQLALLIVHMKDIIKLQR